MIDQKVYPVCVIGGGSAGTMAALRVILNNDECLFFPGSPKNKKRSRALWVRKVENMPSHLGYKRGIEDPNSETLKWISESAFKNNFYIQKNTGVVSVAKKTEFFEITDSKGNTFFSKYIVLCTGVMDVQPSINGTIEKVFDYANAQTIDYCLICDGHHVLGKKTSVIGHGNGAAWAAIMLLERYNLKEITILTNGQVPEFHQDTRKLIELYKINVVESPIVDIIGEETKGILEGFICENGQSVASEICFVSLGLIVYNEIAKQLGANLDERGFVVSDDSGLTSIPGLYVAGDIKANTKKQIYTSWDTAVNAANAINMKIRAARRPS